MKTFLSRLIGSLTLVITLFAGREADPQNIKKGGTDPEAARTFVQSFYKWYLETAGGCECTPRWSIAVKERPSSFSSDLLLALKRDLAAEAKTQGEVVGIDFDPFLNTQEETTECHADEITHETGRKYLVSTSCSSPAATAPQHITAEVSYVNGQWRLVDFRYPGHGSLQSILGGLQGSDGRTK